MEKPGRYESELAFEASRLEIQISRNVIPTAEVVEEQIELRDIITRRSGENDFNFFVDTTKKVELEGGEAVSKRLIQTLGITAAGDSTDLLKFTCKEYLPIPLGPSKKEYNVEADPVIKVMNQDLFNDFDFKRYTRIVELAGHVAAETMEPEEISKQDHLLDPVYGRGYRVLKEKQPDSTNYRHLVTGRKMAEVYSVYKLNGETWRKIVFDDLPRRYSPMIWTHLGETKVVSPKDPKKALDAIKIANELLVESLIFPVDL